MVNGARGRSVKGSDSTDDTWYGTSRRRFARASACSPSRSTTSFARVARIGTGVGIEVATFGDALAVEFGELRGERLFVVRT